jgi:hypothetical protein
MQKTTATAVGGITAVTNITSTDEMLNKTRYYAYSMMTKKITPTFYTQ